MYILFRVWWTCQRLLKAMLLGSGATRLFKTKSRRDEINIRNGYVCESANLDNLKMRNICARRWLRSASSLLQKLEYGIDSLKIRKTFCICNSTEGISTPHQPTPQAPNLFGLNVSPNVFGLCLPIQASPKCLWRTIQLFVHLECRWVGVEDITATCQMWDI